MRPVLAEGTIETYLRVIFFIIFLFYIIFIYLFLRNGHNV